jgi:acyl-CoA hydrolase
MEMRWWNRNCSPIFWTIPISFRLFSAPKMSVSATDYAIGLHASTLIKDGGTLQIGIGSLGDALCYGLQLRQQQNDQYQAVLKKSEIVNKFSETITMWAASSRSNRAWWVDGDAG